MSLAVLVRLNSWADFWDVKKFPGTRAIRLNNVDGVLEPAVMAMGVTARKGL